MWIGTTSEDGSILFKTRDPINCGIGGVRNFPMSSFDVDRMLIPPGKTDDCAFSWHTSGAQFAFIDGSVRFLSEDLDVRLFWLLGDRYGLDGELLYDP